MTLISSLSIDKICLTTVITNSTVNATIFNKYFNELCKSLFEREKKKNVCFILDDAKIHGKWELEQIAGEYGFKVMFLSPYSYMLKPIENVFSKIKSGAKSELRRGQVGDIILDCIKSITLEI